MPSINNSTPGTPFFDLDNLSTYFLPRNFKPSSADPRKLLNSSNYAKLTPFYNDPLTTQAHSPADDMIVFGALVDPFLSVHGCTAVLPNVPLKLPDWTTQSALSKFTGFFHAGPLMTPIDVQINWTKNRAVDSNAPGASLPTEYDLPKMTLPLRVPFGAMNGGSAKWRWLQPYIVDEGVVDDGKENDVLVTRFNAFGVSDDAATGADAVQARLMLGPYTVMEGFVELVRSD